MNARIVVHHYGAIGFDVVPLMPVLFTRDFLHILLPAGDEAAHKLEEHNPNRSVFHVRQPDPSHESPDVISATMPIADRGALAQDQSEIVAHASCIIVRGPLMQLYLGKGLPAALSKSLEAGFRFAGFLKPLAQSPASDVRVGAIPINGDAVFLRDIAGLQAVARSDDDFCLKTLKLAFLAIGLGQVFYGLEALGKARDLAASPQAQRALGYRNYDRFLRDVAAASKNSAAFLEEDPLQQGSEPPESLVAQVAGTALMRRRLAGALEILRGRMPPALWVPGLWAQEWDPMAYWMLPLSARKGLGVVRRLWRAWKALSQGVPLSAPFTPGPDRSRASPLETLLDSYGFWVVARDSYATRMSRPRR